jgi:hypothetical protein
VGRHGGGKTGHLETISKNDVWSLIASERRRAAGGQRACLPAGRAFHLLRRASGRAGAGAPHRVPGAGWPWSPRSAPRRSPGLRRPAVAANRLRPSCTLSPAGTLALGLAGRAPIGEPRPWTYYCRLLPSPLFPMDRDRGPDVLCPHASLVTRRAVRAYAQAAHLHFTSHRVSRRTVALETTCPSSSPIPTLTKGHGREHGTV